MQPDTSNTMLRIAKKEITLFFASPIAYLFLGSFATITLFVFFWGEAFFSRNIADVRPLFEWMPILLIFLSATLTMRLWSEERRSGTLEHVLTQSIPLWHFVTGKFTGCLVLLTIALIVTLPLPITVALIGDLDWGPVLAGYLATLLMGAAYLSIGLFVSSRSDNQIVSLISASALCGFFYLLGTPLVTDFFGNQAGEWLRLLGTGSRFDSITRGVIDFRDLYYYLSIVAVFLLLNTLMLEQERWSKKSRQPGHSHWRTLTTLLIVNVLGANLWLGQLNLLRADVTEGGQYSISDATHGYLAQLQEPLLLRGYFSGKTHPLLAPLAPQLRDLIREYEIAGNGKVRVEFVDPLTSPEKEEEANQKYGIQPVPFQVADRYQSSIVSSYFNVLVQYGDEHQVLGFRDLIEIFSDTGGDIDVQLRNPEHDLTRSIKKVLHSYQAGGNLFDTVKGDLKFNAYLSPDDRLPRQLVEFRQVMGTVLAQAQQQSSGRFSVEVSDPEANGGELAGEIAENLGFRPMSTSLFSNQRFYYYMTLSNGDQVVQIPLDDMTESRFKDNLETGIKRFASGFTRTLALVTPEASPGFPPAARFSKLESFLGAELNVQREDLSDGIVSSNADLLLLLAPKALDDKQLFAVDQFLMQGGTVIVATSPYSASLGNQGLSLAKYQSGLNGWLQHHGLSIEEKLVLDPQNAAFPVPVTRNVGGFQLQEIKMLDYPYFIDARGDGLNQSNLITSELPQATLTWASPISLDADRNKGRQLTELIRSSNQAWISSSLNIMPTVTRSGVSGFTPGDERGSYLLGLVSAGRFDSFFAGKESPLLAEIESDADAKADELNESESEQNPAISAVIEKSSNAARIILFSSNDFLNDQIIQLAGAASRSEYLNTLQMTANAVDWSLEDAGLLSIRSRGQFNRTLPPMTHDHQLFWEYLNYGLAILALILIAMLERYYRRAKQRRYLELYSS
ncbi:MAG: Gldg family protein [Gammaproteobacteria bacterium]|nr:Gldg family protein [Gammaproteobacteria bacterium]